MTTYRPLIWRTKEETKAEIAEMNSTLAFLEEESQLLQVQIQALQDSIKSRQDYLANLENKVLIFPNSKEGKIQPNAKGERSPMEMLRSQYKGMKLGDIAARVLEEQRAPLTTTELSQIIYDVKSDDELYRARNSLSGELRSGAKCHNPRWRKVGRYAYASAFMQAQEVRT